MKRVAHGQLSFDAAPKAGKRQVDMAAVKLSGTLPPESIVDNEGQWPQLGHGERVKIVLVEEGSGEVIAEAPGCVQITYTDKDDKTVRVQTVKVGDAAYHEDGVAGAVKSFKDFLDENGITATLK